MLHSSIKYIFNKVATKISYTEFSDSIVNRVDCEQRIVLKDNIFLLYSFGVYEPSYIQILDRDNNTGSSYYKCSWEIIFLINDFINFGRDQKSKEIKEKLGL